jgi:FAD/FMN-containing dehydrogenase
VTWGEFDRETQAFGLATVGGTVTNTGIAGLTLGGGIGWLTRQYGLSCDNLLSADVVTAAGGYLTASATEHPDLYWGLRGGGGNFGIVTSFEYQLHPVTDILGGLVLYPAEQTSEVLRFYADFSRQLPEEASAVGGLLTSPDGAPVVAIAVFYNGPAAAGEAVLRPLRAFGAPLLQDLRPRSYCEMQGMLDAMFPPGRRSYMKSMLLQDISADLIERLVEHALPLPSPLSFVAFQQMGGVASRIDHTTTAFGHREAQYDLLFHAIGRHPADDTANIQWARQLFEAMEPFTGDGVYLNNIGSDQEGRDGVKTAWDQPTYARLVALKQQYDPTNLFRHNQNILPTV